jgi:hypothetical protein
MGGITKALVSLAVLTGLLLSTGTAFHDPCPGMRAKPSLFVVPRAHQNTREGAVPVEWERIGESHEEDQDFRDYRTCSEGHSNQFGQDTDVVHRAIFCGYKVTKEDYRRLRSADPDEPPPEDYSI